MNPSKQTVQKKGKELEQIVRRIEELIINSDPTLQIAELIFESNKFITVNGVRHEIDLHVHAPNPKATHSAEPNTYEGNFFIDQERVRGIGHNYVGRRNFRAKKRIPEGWHQNIVDPTKPTTHDAYNRHDPLPDFQPTDFEDFTRKIAAMWTIDLEWEGGLL